MNIYRHGRLLLCSAIAATLLTAACGTRGDKTGENSRTDKTVQQLPGDSMVYGLACDGCNDTILVLLRLLLWPTRVINKSLSKMGRWLMSQYR